MSTRPIAPETVAEPAVAGVEPSPLAPTPVADAVDQSVRTAPQIGAQADLSVSLWLAASPRRAISACAAALIVTQLIMRGWIASTGWFAGDDFVYLSRARTMPFPSNQYLAQEYGGHLMPGVFLLVRVMNALWPMNYTAVILVDSVLELAVAVLVWQLLRALFGDRPAILLPLAIFLFSPLTLPAFLWWAGALLQLPQQLAIAGALLLHVGYLRTGSLRRGIAGALAVAVGLLFYEKAVLVVPVIMAITLCYFTAGPFRQRWTTAMRRHLPVWLAYLAVCVAYGGYRLAYVSSPAQGHPSIADYLHTTSNSVLHAVLPGLLGGPWRWLPLSSDDAVAHPPTVAVWLVAALALVAAAGSILLWRRAVFGWLIFTGYVVANVLLLVLARVSAFGTVIGNELRYTTDVCLVAVLALSLAFLPVQGSYAKGEPQPLLPRSRRWSRHRAVPHVALGEGGLTACLVLALIVSASVSSVRFGDFWKVSPPRSYLTRAEHDLAAAGRPLTLAVAPVPDDVLWSANYPYNLTDHLLDTARPRPSFLRPGASADNLYIPDSTGAIREAAISGVQNRPGPIPGWGWPVDSAGATIPLLSTTMDWMWIVRIGYISSTDATARVTVGHTSTAVSVHKGLHAVFVMGNGAIDSIRISELSNGAHLTTNDVRVGLPVAAPGTRP